MDELRRALSDLLEQRMTAAATVCGKQGSTPSDGFWLAGCAVGLGMFYLWRTFYPGALVETLLA